VPRFGMRSRVCECPRRKCTRENDIVCLYFPLHPLEREGVALISTLRYLTTSKPSAVYCAALQLFCHQQRAHRRAGLAQGCGRARTHGYSSSFRDPGGREERKGGRGREEESFTSFAASACCDSPGFCPWNRSNCAMPFWKLSPLPLLRFEPTLSAGCDCPLAVLSDMSLRTLMPRWNCSDWDFVWLLRRGSV